MSRLLRKNNGLSPLRSGIVNVLTQVSLTRPLPRGPSEANDNSPASSAFLRDLLIRGGKLGLRAVLGISQHPCYTVRRARPLARRRANTFRPFLVLIRLRNPCSRFFFRFEGC